MKDFNIRKNTVKKLSIFNTLIFILIEFVLYFSIPFLLNYPPNSINNDFQLNIVGITYTNQFIILISTVTLIFYFIITFIYNKTNNTIEKERDINNYRKKCFNYPYILLLIEIFFPVLIAGFLLKIFNTDFELLVRLCTIIFSFSTVFAILSYVLNKKFFVDKIIETSKLNNEKNGMRLTIYNKLLIQILPLFLYSLVIILLFSISIMTTEKGDLLHHFYKQELSNSFDQTEIYKLSDVKEILSSIKLKSSEDSIFIFSATNGNVYYSEEKLNDFLIQYTMNFYDITDGHSYEYYGQNVSSSILKIHTQNGDYFVGIRYFVFSNNFIVPFIWVAIILIFFNMLFVIYIGKNLSNDINRVTFGLNSITKSNDIINPEPIPLTSNDEIGDLTISFNKIQDLTKNYIKQIHDNQDTLMEKERLASLGQLIGGIAHNLKTPIMSISGATEGLSDLIKEYDSCIEDPEVNFQDHHEIASDMFKWIEKIRNYTEYMSDVITAVKGQAVALSEENKISFTLTELIKRVDILMKHELKNALIYLKVKMKTDEHQILNGDVNALVQVINNMISNSIQAYNGKPNQDIDMTLENKDNQLIISITDYASGMPENVKEKLFKEMVTTKGKNGTGLGLYMSYSTIKAHFNGTITVESEEGKGTTFSIILPFSNKD